MNALWITAALLVAGFAGWPVTALVFKLARTIDDRADAAKAADDARRAAEDPSALAGYDVLALCETAKGITNAGQIAEAPNVVALMWGAEDLIASLGGTSSRGEDGSYREVARFARSQVLLHAATHGKAAVDSVYLDIPDLEGLGAESRDAKASGFAAKASIHPNQMPVIREAFAPTEAELDRARRILDAAKENPGVFAFEGQMVDEPLLRQARATLGR